VCVSPRTDLVTLCVTVTVLGCVLNNQWGLTESISGCPVSALICSVVLGYAYGR
jgi:hypothetical protein